MDAAAHDAGHDAPDGARAPRRVRLAALLALLTLALVTLLLIALRPRLDKVHVALLYLLVVLGGSAVGGRTLGVLLSVASFVCFDVFFLPPYNTLRVADPLDWLVLVAFLVTGLVAAQLLYRAQAEAARARRHAAEVDRLSRETQHMEALREADRLKDALVATVSHDLRTPLTTIRGLAHDIAAGGDERAYVIQEEVDRLNRFVADMLDLSRLDAGGLPLAVALNAAEDLIGAALQRMSGVPGNEAIRASLDPATPILVGRFDFTRSLHILVNLLENALKYAPPGTPVDFTVRREGNALVFTVADRGPGIPASERERIFAPFYRPGHAPPDVGSAGLGLAIARRLARAQGGDLAAAPRDGGGTAFALTLPAADLDDVPTGMDAPVR